jgi:hypothetical protein
MKHRKATAILLFVWLVAAVSSADKLYIWTDKSGGEHITQEPPPKGAQTNSVMNYTPEPEKEVQRYRQRQRQELENYFVGQRRQEALDARSKADQTRREAEEARIEADLVTRQSQEYIETHNRNQYMRRAFKYERRKAAEKAEAARQNARQAAKVAREAEEKARLAEQRLQQALKRRKDNGYPENSGNTDDDPAYRHLDNGGG